MGSLNTSVCVYREREKQPGLERSKLTADQKLPLSWTPNRFLSRQTGFMALSAGPRAQERHCLESTQVYHQLAHKHADKEDSSVRTQGGGGEITPYKAPDFKPTHVMSINLGSVCYAHRQQR